MTQRSRCARLRSFKHAKIQTFKVFSLFILLSFELLNPLNVEQAFAQTNFYQGKTVRIIVGNLPGDTHDLFARAYSRSMGKHILGNPAILVQNMPGAGGMIAANHVYNVAKPDGLTLGSPSPALYYAQLVGSKEENHCDDGEDQHHDGGNHRLTPRRPRHLRRLRPYLLQEGKGVRCL